VNYGLPRTARHTTCLQAMVIAPYCPFTPVPGDGDQNGLLDSLLTYYTTCATPRPPNAAPCITASRLYLHTAIYGPQQLNPVDTPATPRYHVAQYSSRARLPSFDLAQISAERRWSAIRAGYSIGQRSRSDLQDAAAPGTDQIRDKSAGHGLPSRKSN